MGIKLKEGKTFIPQGYENLLAQDRLEHGDFYGNIKEVFEWDPDNKRLSFSVRIYDSITLRENGGRALASINVHVNTPEDYDAKVGTSFQVPNDLYTIALQDSQLVDWESTADEL